MFLESSRYAKLKAITVKVGGREAQGVVLRRLPYVPGVPMMVKDNDRLDIIAQTRYKDPTRFWHIADANTELQAGDLLEETARVILVPEK